MPTYEYECKQCNHKFEQFQRMTAEPLKDCPECGGAVKRLIGSGAGIIFKGSGFYCTDYKNSNSAKTNSSGKTDISVKTDSPAKTSSTNGNCKKCCDSADACPKK